MRSKVIFASLLILFLMSILPITSKVACVDQSNDFLVGAVYMTFWGTGMDIDWPSGAVYWSINDTYSSNDSTMANYHIKLAIDHNIDFFFLDYGWGNNTERELMENATLNGLLKADNMKNFKFCIFYFPDRVVEQGFFNKSHLENDFSHMNTTYFSRSSYLRLNGRSVIILNEFTKYLGVGNSTEINNVFYSLKEKYNLTMIPAFWPEHNHTAVLEDHRKIYDAITLMGQETILKFNQNITYEQYLSQTEQYFSEWNQTVESFGVDFVPLICPGYNNTIYYTWEPPKKDFLSIVYRDPNYFDDVCRLARDYSTEPHNLILLFTWNDFKEGTSIEPTTDYNFTYLEIVRDYIPEFPSFLILPLFMIKTLLAVITYRRNHSK